MDLQIKLVEDDIINKFKAENHAPTVISENYSKKGEESWECSLLIHY